MRRGIVLLFVAALGCRSEPRPAPEPAPPPARPAIRLLVDGASAAEVEVAALATRPTLASLIGARAPVATWRQLEAKGPSGPSMFATRLDEAYRDQDAILYLDDGRPALGMFRRVAPDATATIRALAAEPTNSMAGISEIRIRTDREPRPEPSPTRITLAAGDRECTLDAVSLAKVRPGVRGRGGADRSGWDVRDLTTACFGAPPIAVRVPGLEVDAATLARADRVVIAKVNRRGVLTVRLIEPVADRPRVLAEATPARIDVTLRP